jgi:hypothetical protein
MGEAGPRKTMLLVVFAKKGFPEVYVPTVFERYVVDVQYVLSLTMPRNTTLRPC